MKQKQKKILMAVSILLVLLLIIFLGFFQKKKPKNSEITQVVPTEATIPTVDSSVQVELLPKIIGKEVLLKVSNIPTGTKSFEYSLSYETRQQGIQGVIGTVNLTENETIYEKQLTLGTCSSGQCVYHEVIGPIKLSLKFVGDYGEKIFEKDYQM